MVSPSPAVLTPRLTLSATTAEELMTPNPVSIRADATLQELIVLLNDKGIAAAPVIDEAGQPVGVVSRADVLTHNREAADHAETEAKGGPGHGGVQARDLMTPVVFSVRPETPAAQVVEEMVAMRVHRLFVIDDTGVPVGVISAFDILRRLRPEYF